MSTVHTRWRNATTIIFYSCVQYKSDSESWWHAMPDVVITTPYIIRLGVWFRNVMACNTWRRPSLCHVKGQWFHASPNVERPYVLFKGYDNCPLLISSNLMCCQREMMACHAQHHPTVCAFKGPWWLTTPDIVRSYVLSNGDVSMLFPTWSICLWV